MINPAKKLTLFAAAVGVALGVTNLFQPSLALTNAGVITTLGTPLTENFDTLNSSGSTTWVNGDSISPLPTIPGWYHARSGSGTTIVADHGSLLAGALYSYGPAGNTDRALGSIGSGNAAAGNFFWGARLSNATGTTITGLTVSYTGEQWRNSGAGAAQTVAFSYRIGSGLGNALTDFTTLGTAVPQLNFTSPVSAGSAVALDGNAAQNRVAISFTITGFSLADGQEILLRWSDPDHSGADHGLAIDDLSVTAVQVDPAPTVVTTSPANGATDIPITAPVLISFSESVNAGPGAFSIQCPTGSPQSFTGSSSPGDVFQLTPNANLPYGTTCTVTVVANQVTDEDLIDPNDQMAADYVFSFTTEASPVDLTTPSVTGTNPADGATDVPVGSNITINFNESVNASASAFHVSCGATQSFALSASPAASFTLDPDANLPYSATCSVTVFANQISDQDGVDPPDQMAADHTFSFTTEDPPPPVATNVIINEVDSDQVGSDSAEFVELYDGGAGNTSLTGLAVVFVNGNGEVSYAVFDLDGHTTNASGYFTLGNPGVPGVDLTFPPGTAGLLQNGADGVALYVGNLSDFPNGTPATLANLQDFIAYDNGQPDDLGLLGLLNPGEPQVNEGGAATSSSRCDNGTGGQRNTSTYLPRTPTPDAANNCPVPTNAPVVISQVYGGGGNDDATYLNDYVELYNRSAAPVDLTGWSLQYASANGNAWAFANQPIGGTIGVGQYYLIALGSGGGDGVALPPANITGQTNISATSGKLALVNSFDPLEGNCPVGGPTVVDFVGYGGADCREGPATAASPSATTAAFRKNGGATDTDDNGGDFVLAAPTPRRTATIVELGPLVFGTDPRANSLTAPRDLTVQVTFTEPVNVAGSWFDITCATSGAHDSATFGSSGLAHYITPNATFVPGEQCTVTIFAAQISDQDTDDLGADTDNLPANHTWSFTVATGTAPPYAQDVHLAMGKPSDAIADIGQPNNFLMEKPEFALSYDRDLGRPNWVSWHLSDEWIGTLTRVDTFRADPAVPADWYRVQSFDFVNSGFDRGHMVPNADRDKETSIPINQATFLMTNMLAQSPDNNQGPWASLENYLRTLLPADELYIVAGGVGTGGTGGNGGVTMTLANGQVAVPAQTWKVALVLPKGDDDLSRVTCSTRTIAVVMPNIQGIRFDENNQPIPWENFLTTVNAVEALTGYDFFSNLPPQIQYCIQAGTNGVGNLPLDDQPPSITCASPDGAWHDDNVELSCTAADGGSGLANDADASFSLMTSIADGTEDANASTDSRVVCDNAGNCATAGPIAGNKIDRKAPEISLVTPPEGAVYQLNKVIAASFSCTDASLATCNGTVANGAAIDTSSTGLKSFTVTATDSAGHLTAVTVSYTVATNAISISNIPTSAFLGNSFVPAFDYAGDGTTSVTSSTPDKCTVSGGTVTFLTKGTCTLVAHATGTALFDAATGAPQSFTITKHTTTISIANIPGTATAGGSFTPVFAYSGDGTTHVRSETHSVCKVNGGTVEFVGLGTCTLTAWATASGTYEPAEGEPQSFVVGPGQ